MLKACTGIRRSGQRTAAALAAALMLAAFGTPARAEDGARTNATDTVEENLLVGVGLVIGLPGTGDSIIDPELVEASIVGVLRRAGFQPWRNQIKPGRVAAVMLSAELPGGSGEGSKFDVNVAAIGDARSIAGGTLLVAPLRDADGVVHATGRGFLIAIDAPSPGSARAGAGDPRAAVIADGAVAGHRSPAPDYASLTPPMPQD